MKILVVMAHPGRDSLTGQVTDAVINSLKVAGHGTELADLYSEDFDPPDHTAGRAGLGEQRSTTPAKFSQRSHGLSSTRA
ncbi:NAD(P)H-dependent oxidoreductase [Gammaproteobacteria bacterium]|nr:NAD(P)H-dependent oxidoreductase [Gammaproteobacteria bacterium]